VDGSTFQRSSDILTPSMSEMLGWEEILKSVHHGCKIYSINVNATNTLRIHPENLKSAAAGVQIAVPSRPGLLAALGRLGTLRVVNFVYI